MTKNTLKGCGKHYGEKFGIKYGYYCEARILSSKNLKQWRDTALLLGLLRREFQYPRRN